MRRLAFWSMLLCLASLLAGCAGVTVSAVSPRDYLAQRRGDVLTTGRLSEAAQEVLRVLGTDGDACDQDMPACRQMLAASTGVDEEQRLSTLSELWLLAALRASGDRRAAGPGADAPAPASEDQQLDA